MEAFLLLMLRVLVGLGEGDEVGGMEVGLPTEATVFSSPQHQTGSSVNAKTCPFPRERDAFSSGLMRPSRGAAQLLPSSGVYRKY
jgi:hypothetical protein